MEQIDDRHFLEPPDEPNRCPIHDCKQPCEACLYEERD